MSEKNFWVETFSPTPDLPAAHTIPTIQPPRGAMWQVEGMLPALDDPLLSIEDSGSALIGDIYDDIDTGMFVRIQSWNDQTLKRPYSKEQLEEMHPEFARFAGRKIRITVEVIED